MEEPQPTLIDQLFDALEQLILPDWSNLFQLLPWVVLAAVIVFFIYTMWQWRRSASRTRSRVPRPLAGGTPPPDVHLPGPSRWPFVVPIGAALLLLSFALPPRDAAGDPVGIFNPILFWSGTIVTLIAVWGWLIDAFREWRAVAAAEQHGGALVVHGQQMAVSAGGAGLVPGSMTGDMALAQAGPESQRQISIRWPFLGIIALALAVFGLFVSGIVLLAGIVLGIIAAIGWMLYSGADTPIDVEPPEGVHLPGPSPWPFLAPISMAVLLLGVVFSAVLLVAGVILGVIAAAGWLIDAGREYETTEEVGHAVPVTRDPEKVWPRRLVQVYAWVIGVSLLIAIAPPVFSWLNTLTPPEATPTPIVVPAVPEISASNAVSFDISTLIVPAGRPFDLVFINNDPGVPHNVEIADGPARTIKYLDGEVIDGVATITYRVPALAEGDYYFLCAIHPNMNGTVKAMTETSAPPGGQPAPGASPAQQATPAP